MARTSSFKGKLTKPQLNVHTTNDGIVPVEAESAYKANVRRAGTTPLLRQTYIKAAGHCTFTPGEILSAVETINDRVDSGRWGDTKPAAMNRRATEADPESDTRYAPYVPGSYPRPFSLSSLDRG